MKKGIVAVVLVCAMVLAFSAVAMADHSPLFIFDFQAGAGVTAQGTVAAPTAFGAVFPANAEVEFDIDNGSWALGTATPHSGYSQSTAKCATCHQVHRAPTAGTSTFASKILSADTTGGTSSSRYKASAWTASASTQLLLRSTAAGACYYCHVTSGPQKMYGGMVAADGVTLPLNADGEFGWGEFYAHTAGCTSCHAVHGAYTLKSADGTVDAKILKYQGVKNLGTIPLVVQPEVYAGNPALYTSKANMLAGSLSASATAAGVTPLAAAVTAQCSICHASYAVGEEVINNNLLNAELFQPASWKTANGVQTQIFVGSAASPVSVLPGVAGLTYTGGTPTAMTGAAGSLILKYKNHPMKAGGQDFRGAGAGAAFSAGQPGIVVSNTGSSTCQSCHNSPVNQVDGGYVYQSFPHYTPGYYKFLAAENQAAFSTPSNAAEYMMGRIPFYDSKAPGKPAVMNDGYCTKCHTTVGTTY